MFRNLQRSQSKQSSVCVCVCTFDGTVPAQLSLRSPVTGAPHRGAGSSDGRLLLGIYGKWQLPLNKAGVAGEGKTTEVPNHERARLTQDEIYFLCSAWQFGWKCAIHTLGPGDWVRESKMETERVSPTLNLLPLFGVMVYEAFLLGKITFLTWLPLDELFHISLTYLFKS